VLCSVLFFILFLNNVLVQDPTGLEITHHGFNFLLLKQWDWCTFQ